MSYDERKVDETCLALLRLTSFKHHGVTRAASFSGKPRSGPAQVRFPE